MLLDYRSAKPERVLSVDASASYSVFDILDLIVIRLALLRLAVIGAPYPITRNIDRRDVQRRKIAGMPCSRKRLIFDTSGLNALADDPDFESLALGLGIACSVRLNETNLGEIGATQKPERRHELLRVCRRLIACGECMEPYHATIIKLITEHSKNPSGFIWNSISVPQQGVGRRTHAAGVPGNG
jgi:hypothetical protein